MVDEERIAFNPAVEISYLSKLEQETLLEAMELYQCTPSLSQAQKMKLLHKANNLDNIQIFGILSQMKGNQQNKVSLSVELLKPFFPKGYTPKQMEKSILKILEAWKAQQKSI